MSGLCRFPVLTWSYTGSAYVRTESLKNADINFQALNPILREAFTLGSWIRACKLYSLWGTHQKDAVAFSVKGLCFQILDTFVWSFINAASFLKYPSELLLPGANLAWTNQNRYPLSSSGSAESTWKQKPMLLQPNCPGLQTGFGEKFKGQPCTDSLNWVL